MADNKPAGAERYRAVFLFCPHDNCMLTPTEDKELQRLIYRCRVCSYRRDANTERVEEMCVHRRDINFVAKEDVVVPPDVVNDKSLPRIYTYECPYCDCKEAVFYRLPEAIVSDAMAIIFVCAGCRNWKREGKEGIAADTDVRPLHYRQAE